MKLKKSLCGDKGLKSPSQHLLDRQHCGVEAEITCLGGGGAL